MRHPLDNPVWSSLASHHRSIARKAGHAARYPGDIAPFVAVDAFDSAAATQLKGLVDAEESVLFVGPSPTFTANWIVEPATLIAQLTCDQKLAVVDGPEMTALSHTHAADVLALTALVYPHYFRARTMEMGRYFGIYDGAKLAAMAGERMRLDGYTELSAICTHPEYIGRGYAQRLVAMLTNDLLDSGIVPFLHVSHQNLRAKTLYERMGYRFRTDIPLLAVSRR